MTESAALSALRRPPQAVLGALSGIINRDGAWFSSLYEESFQPVYRYALLLTRDQHSAEDVTAEVFLRAWRGRDSFRGEGSPLSWLLSIAHNAAISHLRSQRATADIADVEEPIEPGSDPATVLGLTPGAGNSERLSRALSHLTAEQRQVLFLRFFEGLPHEQVAARLGSNANAVRAIQFRALGRLRKLLEGPVAQPA